MLDFNTSSDYKYHTEENPVWAACSAEIGCAALDLHIFSFTA